MRLQAVYDNGWLLLQASNTLHQCGAILNVGHTGMHFALRSVTLPDYPVTHLYISLKASLIFKRK